MIRFIKFSNLVLCVNRSQLIKDNLNHHSVQHYEHISVTNLLNHRRFNSSNNSSNNSNNDVNGSKKTGEVGIVASNSNSDNKLKKETDSKEKGIMKKPAIKRRKYMRNTPKIQVYSEDLKTNKVSVKKKSTKRSNSQMQDVFKAPSSVDTSTTKFIVPDNSKVSDKEDKKIFDADLIKPELLSEKVHIEYMESKDQNINDIVKPLSHHKNDVKKEHEEVLNNTLEKLKDQINDPMLIKLIMRSQLVSKTAKTESDTALDKMEKYNTYSKNSTKDSRVTFGLNTQTVNTPSKNNTNTTIKHSEILEEQVCKDDNIPFSKVTDSVDTDKKTIRVILSLDDYNIHPIDLTENQNTKQNTTSIKSETQLNKNTKKIVLKPEDPKNNSFNEMKSVNFGISENIEKNTKNSKPHSQSSEAKKKIILKPNKTEKNAFNVMHSTNFSEKQVTGNSTIDSKSKSQTPEIPKKMILNPEEPLQNPFNEAEDNITKKLLLRSATEQKVFQNISHKFFETEKLSNFYNQKNDWYQSKVNQIKLKATENTEMATMGTNPSTDRKEIPPESSSSAQKVESISQIKIQLADEYKDQAAKLAEIMNTKEGDIEVRFTTNKSKSGSNTSSSGGGKKGTNIGNSKQKSSKVFTYLRNLCYFVMTLIGSYTVYYMAEFLSHDDVDTMMAVPNWPIKDARTNNVKDETNEQITTAYDNIEEVSGKTHTKGRKLEENDETEESKYNE